MAFIREKNKVAIMEYATLGFHIYKIRQILKRLAGTFCRAQTLKLGGVSLLLTVTSECDEVEKNVHVHRFYFESS